MSNSSTHLSSSHTSETASTSLSIKLFDEESFSDDSFTEIWYFYRDKAINHQTYWTRNELVRRSMEDDEDINSDLAACQAMNRYFMLISEAQKRLSGYFSQDEMEILLDIEPSPTWFFQFRADRNVLCDAVAEKNGIHRPGKFAAMNRRQPDSAICRLMTKLAKLSFIEEVAVVDACEQFWRRRECPVLAN